MGALDVKQHAKSRHPMGRRGRKEEYDVQAERQSERKIAVTTAARRPRD